MTNPHLITFSDGGARGNPGPAGAGGVVLAEDKQTVLKEVSVYLGPMTNNQAEYWGLIKTLEVAVLLKPATITCHLDSELLVKQMKGEYKIKNAELQILASQAKTIISGHQVKFIHVRREYNQHADQLVNNAIDLGLSGKLKPAVAASTLF